MKPNIIIVGRSNVGKSTLFNRLTKSHDAIVGDLAGLTRDIHYGYGKIGDKAYVIIDSGGFEPFIKDEGIPKLIAKQTMRTIDESDVVLFVVDARCGVTIQDKEIANYLRKISLPVYLIVNKSESINRYIAVSDFYELGIKNFYVISASHGEGVHAMIDDILSKFSISEDIEVVDNSSIKFAVIGRPNVGKSTLVNSILGEYRVIAFDKSGTTRDSIDLDFDKNDKKYTIIDTAGLKRNSKVNDKFEKFSIIKTIKSVEKSNVVILVIDACEKISLQDITITSIVLSLGKPLVIAINKWDAISNKQKIDFKQELAYKLYFLDYAEITYISALKKQNINTLFNLIDKAFSSATIKMSTPKITRVLQIAIEKQSPPMIKGIRPKMRYAHQGGSNPPIIVIHGNTLNNISKEYSRYLVKNFRKAFNIIATPLKIQYVSSDNNPFYEKNKKSNLKKVKLNNRIATKENKKLSRRIL